MSFEQRKKPHDQTESGKELMLQMVIAGLQEHAPAPLTNNDVAAWTQVMEFEQS